MGIAIDVSELRALASDLDRAAGRVGADAAAVVRKTAKKIEADAKALAPVGTGNLRNSISTDVEGDGRFTAITAAVGPTAFYGAFVEYGTSQNGPRPYMGPAFERHSPGMVAEIEKILDDLL